MEKTIVISPEDLKFAEDCLARGEHKKYVFNIDELIAEKEAEEHKKYEEAYRTKPVHKHVFA